MMHRPFDQLASGVKSQQQSLLEASGDGAQSRRRPQSSTFRKAMKVFPLPSSILFCLFCHCALHPCC
ncbi:MAG: hypothetical protein ACPIOQ_05550 [Promethearchaeia archaeon]